MQKVQWLLQPSCTLTKARVRLGWCSGASGARRRHCSPSSSADHGCNSSASRSLRRFSTTKLDVGQGGDGLGGQGGVAAGDGQAGGRVAARQPAGQLARLARGLAGDRAGVEHAHVSLLRRSDHAVAGRGQLAAQALHLAVVQATAQGFEVDVHSAAKHNTTARGCQR